MLKIITKVNNISVNITMRNTYNLQLNNFLFYFNPFNFLQRKAIICTIVYTITQLVRYRQVKVINLRCSASALGMCSREL